MEKLQEIDSSINKGIDVAAEDRLTLREFSMVSDLAKLCPIMDKLEKNGIIKGSKTLENLHANAKKAKDITDALEQTTNKELQTWQKLHSDMMAGGQKGDQSMLCSEFSAVMIAVSVVELNAQIKKDMATKGIPTPKDDIVNIPFGKHEDLHKMHPDRLLEELRKAKCIQAATTSTTKYVQEVDVIKQTVGQHISSTKSTPGGPRIATPSQLHRGG